ncbi:MAG: MarR family transcriptional regulator [Pseudomonas sp.]
MNCPSTNPPTFGLLLRQVRDGLMRHLDAEVRQELSDCGFSHYMGLKVLSAQSPCTANELAQALEQTPSAITRLLDKLEAMGAVRREPHAQDRRALQIVMTDQGRRLYKQLKQRGDRVMAFALRDLSAEERDRLTHLLIRVRDSLNSP